MTDDVRQFIHDLHSLWPSGELERLREFYHADVVLLPPDLGTPIRGRDAVVESYREFLDACTLHEFRITDLAIYRFGGAASTSAESTCMVHLHFEIDYSLDGTRYREAGLEIYTVVASDAGLRIVWRCQNVMDTHTQD